jgi:hypothetical protein
VSRKFPPLNKSRTTSLEFIALIQFFSKKLSEHMGRKNNTLFPGFSQRRRIACHPQWT